MRTALYGAGGTGTLRRLKSVYILEPGVQACLTVCLSVSVCLSCSATGQWEDAVRVYSSTPLEELQDLAGLALAYCRAGLTPDSISGKGARLGWHSYRGGSNADPLDVYQQIGRAHV